MLPGQSASGEGHQQFSVSSQTTSSSRSVRCVPRPRGPSPRGWRGRRWGHHGRGLRRQRCLFLIGGAMPRKTEPASPAHYRTESARIASLRLVCTTRALIRQASGGPDLERGQSFCTADTRPAAFAWPWAQRGQPNPRTHCPHPACTRASRRVHVGSSSTRSSSPGGPQLVELEEGALPHARVLFRAMDRLVLRGFGFV